MKIIKKYYDKKILWSFIEQYDLLNYNYRKTETEKDENETEKDETNKNFKFDNIDISTIANDIKIINCLTLKK